MSKIALKRERLFSKFNPLKIFSFDQVGLHSRVSEKFQNKLNIVDVTSSQKKFVPVLNIGYSVAVNLANGTGRSLGLFAYAISLRVNRGFQQGENTAKSVEQLKAMPVIPRGLILVKSRENVLQYKKLYDSLFETEEERLAVPVSFLYKGISEKGTKLSSSHVIFSTPKSIDSVLESTHQGKILKHLKFLAIDDYDYHKSSEELTKVVAKVQSNIRDIDDVQYAFVTSELDKEKLSTIDTIISNNNERRLITIGKVEDLKSVPTRALPENAKLCSLNFTQNKSLVNFEIPQLPHEKLELLNKIKQGTPRLFKNVKNKTIFNDEAFVKSVFSKIKEVKPTGAKLIVVPDSCSLSKLCTIFQKCGTEVDLLSEDYAWGSEAQQDKFFVCKLNQVIGRTFPSLDTIFLIGSEFLESSKTIKQLATRPRNTNGLIQGEPVHVSEQTPTVRSNRKVFKVVNLDFDEKALPDTQKTQTGPPNGDMRLVLFTNDAHEYCQYLWVKNLLLLGHDKLDVL